MWKVLFVFFLQGCYGSMVLTKVTTVTGDGSNCGMTGAFGWITIELIGVNHETCSTEWLDNSGQNDMEPGLGITIVKQA